MAGIRTSLVAVLAILCGMSCIITALDNGQPAFCDACYCFRRNDNTTKAECDPDKLDFTKPLHFPQTPSNVTSLDISFGFSTVDLVDDFFLSFPRLRELYFYLQNVDQVQPMAFRGLPVLEVLYLSHNSMFAFPAIPLRQVAPSLVELNVTHNAIQSLVADSFRGCTKLRSLDLSWLSLRTIDEFAFRGIGALETLVLHGNFLLTLDAHAFDDIAASLVLLDLRTNYFAGVPDVVGGLHSLETFRFSYNPTPFRFHDFGFILRMPKIHTLDFVNCSIHTVSADAVKNLKSAPKLTSVYLYKNPFLCSRALCSFVKFYTSNPGVDFGHTGSSPAPYECSLPGELRGYSLDEAESTLCGFQSTTSFSTSSLHRTTATTAVNNVSSSSTTTSSSSSSALSPSTVRLIVIPTLFNLVSICYLL